MAPPRQGVDPQLVLTVMTRPRGHKQWMQWSGDFKYPIDMSPWAASDAVRQHVRTHFTESQYRRLEFGVFLKPNHKRHIAGWCMVTWWHGADRTADCVTADNST